VHVDVHDAAKGSHRDERRRLAARLLRGGRDADERVGRAVLERDGVLVRLRGDERRHDDRVGEAHKRRLAPGGNVQAGHVEHARVGVRDVREVHNVGDRDHVVLRIVLKADNLVLVVCAARVGRAVVDRVRHERRELVRSVG